LVIDELIAILGYDIKGQGNLDKFNRGLERSAQLAQRLATLLVAAGTIAASALGGLAKSVVDVSADFEGFQASLETIEGSSDKAKKSLDWIADFATKTPYEMAELTRAFIKLKNAGLDPTDGSLETLGDTASAMNVPLNQAVEAMTDAMTIRSRLPGGKTARR
jgi:phage tail tape-measure protein